MLNAAGCAQRKSAIGGGDGGGEWDGGDGGGEWDGGDGGDGGGEWCVGKVLTHKQHDKMNSGLVAR